MSGIYGSTSFVNGPQLNEAKALQEIMSLLQHIDKGELQELLNNEGQINDLISDNEEVRWCLILQPNPMIVYKYKHQVVARMGYELMILQKRSG